MLTTDIFVLFIFYFSHLSTAKGVLIFFNISAGESKECAWNEFESFFRRQKKCGTQLTLEYSDWCLSERVLSLQPVYGQNVFACFSEACSLVLISTDPGHDKHTALIGGIAAVGGFGLVAVIALTALGVKYRMAVAKRFMNVTYV